MPRNLKIKEQVLKTIIIENTWLNRKFHNHGWGNGYVLVPTGHPLYGKKCNEIDINVHGGITFAEEVDMELMLNCGLTMAELGMWMVGFDTAHSFDRISNWPKDMVEVETDKLLSKIQIGDFKIIEPEE